MCTTAGNSLLLTPTTVATDRNKFADCAIACGADYLVTNDRHYDTLKTLAFPSVQIIRAEEFLRIVDGLGII
jgi:predicted nucleic acid-binding protein